MELKHLIVRYRYLKFFVEAFEQSIIADDSAETAQQELYLKYKQAKTYLSFIETAITMLPINKRSNYNNQYEFVFRKVYIEGVQIKKIEELLFTSIRNAYEIRNRALNMIEERVNLMFDYRFQIILLDAPQKYPVIRPFSYCGQSVLDAYFDLIVKKTNSELGVIEGKLAYAVLHYKNRRMICYYRFIRSHEYSNAWRDLSVCGQQADALCTDKHQRRSAGDLEPCRRVEVLPIFRRV